MRTAAQERAHAHSIAQVVDYMRRLGLSRDDLIDFGGEDLRSPRTRHRAGKLARSRNVGR